MTMKPEIRNRIEMLKKQVVAELPSAHEGKTRWISVLPIPDRHPLDPTPPAPGKIRIALFVIDRSKLTGTSPFDGDLEEHQVDWANTTEELEHKLLLLGIDSSLLEVPWKTDFPG